MSEELQHDKGAIEASRCKALLDCEPAPERRAETPSQRINIILNALSLELPADIISHARRELLEAFGDAIAVQRERDASEITRLTIERNALNDANAIMRDALERIFYASDTKMGDGAQRSAGIFQGVAEKALAVVNGKAI